MEDNVKRKLLMLLLFLWYCLSAILLAPILIEYFFDENNLFSELFSEFLSVVIPVLIVKTVKDKKREKYLFKTGKVSLKMVGGKKVLGSIMMIIAYFFFVQYMINGIHICSYIMTGDFGEVFLLSQPNFITFILSVFVYALLPSVFEEMHYRAYYFECFKTDKLPILLLCSSITFASAHINTASIINAFFIGMLLMILYKKLHSFILIVILHFIYNFLDLLFSTYISIPYSMLDLLNDYANVKQNKAAVLISFGCAVLFLSVLIVMFRYVIAKEVDSFKEETEECSCSKYRVVEYAITSVLLVLAVVLIFLKVQ